MPYSRIASRLVLALAPLLAAGCANDGIDGTPVNTCLTSRDCTGGSTCDTSTHVCVAPGATTEVVFYATPPAGTQQNVAAATQLEPQVVGTSTTFDIALRPAVAMSGTITAMPYGAMPSIAPSGYSARVEFRQQGGGRLIPPITVNATASGGTGVRTYTWSQSLPEGVYDVTIVPEAPTGAASPPDLPPNYLPGGLTVASDGNHSVQFAYPDNQVLHGQLLAVGGAPITGVRVQAVDTSDGSVHSTQAVTDPSGDFDIALSPDVVYQPMNAVSVGVAADWALEITPVAREAGPPGHLVYRVARAALPDAGLGADRVSITLATSAGFVVGGDGACNGCQRVDGSVEGTLTNGADAVVTGGSVDFRSDTVIDTSRYVGHTAFFQAHAALDAMGGYAAQLLPGRYDVVITPNTPSGFAVTHIGPDHFLITDHALHSHVLTPDRLVPVTGRIAVAGGAAGDLSGFQVSAVPSAAIIDPSRLSATDALARPAPAQTTLADGTYALSLDPGPYRIVVVPPPTSALATLVSDRDVFVTARYATTDLVQPVTFTVDPIELPAPVRVRGQVVDQGGTAVGGAGVLAFARLRAVLSPGRPAATLDVQLGNVTADSDGVYNMLLSGQGP